MSLTADPAETARPSRVPSPLGVGVIVWLASEAMFFSGLFGAYYTLRSVNEVWPPNGVELPVARTSVATVVLIVSSGSMHMAIAASRRHDPRGAVRWLAVTAVLGSLFISNQLLEYSEAPFSVSSNAYGTIFFVMTGFHGLHVIGGLVFIGATAIIVSGRSRAPIVQSVEVCGYYWHFVDVVWVAMFSTIYLLQ